VGSGHKELCGDDKSKMHTKQSLVKAQNSSRDQRFIFYFSILKKTNSRNAFLHVSPYMHSGFVAMLPCPSQPPPSHCRQMDNDMSEIAQGNRYDKPNHRTYNSASNVKCTISHYYKTTRKSYWSNCLINNFII